MREAIQVMQGGDLRKHGDIWGLRYSQGKPQAILSDRETPNLGFQETNEHSGSKKALISGEQQK